MITETELIQMPGLEDISKSLWLASKGAFWKVFDTVHQGHDELTKGMVHIIENILAGGSFVSMGTVLNPNPSVRETFRARLDQLGGPESPQQGVNELNQLVERGLVVEEPYGRAGYNGWKERYQLLSYLTLFRCVVGHEDERESAFHNMEGCMAERHSMLTSLVGSAEKSFYGLGFIPADYISAAIGFNGEVEDLVGKIGSDVSCEEIAERAKKTTGISIRNEYLQRWFAELGMRQAVIQARCHEVTSFPYGVEYVQKIVRSLGDLPNQIRQSNDNGIECV